MYLLIFIIIYVPDSNLHLVLQQDQQTCGHFDIFYVAQPRFQTHHNEDKKLNPSCDEKNSIFLISLVSNININILENINTKSIYIMNDETYFYSRQLS